MSDTESDEDLRLLLAPGSSLGGARPKASVRDHDRRLADCQVPEQRRRGEYGTVGGRGADSLAVKAGITVLAWRLEIVAWKAATIATPF